MPVSGSSKHVNETSQCQIMRRFHYHYTNNFPTRCNTKQSIYYPASSLYMFPVSAIPIIRSTQNCNYSLRYRSYFLCSCLPPTWPGSSLATLEGGSYTKLSNEIQHKAVYLLFCKFTLHVSGVSHTHHHAYTKL